MSWYQPPAVVNDEDGNREVAEDTGEKAAEDDAEEDDDLDDLTLDDDAEVSVVIDDIREEVSNILHSHNSRNKSWRHVETDIVQGKNGIVVWGKCGVGFAHFRAGVYQAVY